MGSEWPEYRLGEVTTWSSGGTPPKKDESYWNGDIPWISASSMYGNRYTESKLQITPEGLKAGSRLAPKGSILLLVRGSMLHQKIPVGIAERDVSFNQDVKAIKVIDGIVDPWFLLFWFMSNETDLLSMVENTGIGAGKLDTTLLQNMVIRIPPLNERQAIVTFVKAMDDKIELNRRMNATLEGMAQALFKSWFVDFDPVIDNALAAGNPIPEELAERAEIRSQALANGTANRQAAKQFPAAFQLSEELGWIPEGWEVVHFNQILKKYIDNRGKTPPLSITGIPMIEVKHITDDSITPNLNTGKYVDENTFKTWFRCHLNTDDIVISTVGTIGRICMVSEGLNLVIAQNLLGLRFDKKKASPFFMYYQMKGFRFKHDVDARLVITVQASIKRKDLETINLLAPSIEIQTAFEAVVKSLIQKQTSRQNHSLTKLRDTLLPKLISGELRIPDAEKLTGEALA
jgi:type I restriction enzyme, S subunit